jgi:hypothetical protein
MTFALAASQPALLAMPATQDSSPNLISTLVREGMQNFWDCIPHAAASQGNEDKRRLHAILSRTDDLESQLQEVKRAAKIEISNLAPRISNEWLVNLRWQLDEILDPDSWDDDDKILSVDSWRSFLRGLFIIRPKRLPGIGISRDGNVVASWSRASEHLDVEFKPNDQTRWVLAAENKGEIERVSGRTSAFRLPEVLAPYQPERWFVA